MVDLIYIWLIVGMFVVGGRWVNPKRPFYQDYLIGLGLLISYPFLMVLSLFIRDEKK